MIELIGYALLALGVTGDLFGAIALMRFGDVTTRIPGAVKCVTFGTGCIMAGVFVINGLTATGIKALLCGAFVLIALPVMGHALARAGYACGSNAGDAQEEERTGDQKKTS